MLSLIPLRCSKGLMASFLAPFLTHSSDVLACAAACVVRDSLYRLSAKFVQCFLAHDSPPVAFAIAALNCA